MPRRDSSEERGSNRRKPAGRSGARSTSSRSGRSNDDSKRSSRGDSKPFSKSPRGGKSYGRSKDDSSFDKPARTGDFKSRSEGTGYSRSRDERDETKRPSRYSDSKDSSERSTRSGNFRKRSEDSGFSSRSERPRTRDDRDETKRPSRFSDKPQREGFRSRSEGTDSSRSRDDRDETKRSSRYADKPEGNFRRRSEDSSGEKPFKRTRDNDDTRDSEKSDLRHTKFSDKDDRNDNKKGFFSKLSRGGKSFARTAAPAPEYGSEISKSKEDLGSDKIRLNRYISNSGICSRREADEFIKMGLVTVNGNVVTEMGHKVSRKDVVKYDGKTLRAEKPVYILMNKPKGFLTTTKDPQDRNTVMQIIADSVKERVYPVGRLDRNTTGLLLLTNDGELTDKLSHPSYNVKKIYKAELDKPITKADFEKVKKGVHLEEGKAVVDDLAIVSDDGKTVGIEVHIGWNRVIRRIFESLGYEVVKLDRSVYAGLDKKDLSRGHWRHLTREEVVRLKHYK